jgi:alpha-tubulin suppressor-like RCC1 family protein
VQEFYSDTTWCQVANNTLHNIAIKTNGTLWAWGTGTNGRLGDGTNISKCSPVQEFCSDTTWSQATAGCFHSSAVKTSGTLWTWGCGGSGQLGDGTTLSICSPVQEFCSDTTWCQVAAGCTNTVAIKTGGTLWSWGCGQLGVLGDGTILTKCSPVQEISGDTTWCQVNAGRTATSALKSDGTLWSWGWNQAGRLGDGTNTSRCSPVQEICSDTTWCQVKSSDYATTAAIKTDSTLWTWGSQRCGISLTGVATFLGRCSPTQEYTNDTNWCFVSLGCFHGEGIKFSG